MSSPPLELTKPRSIIKKHGQEKSEKMNLGLAIICTLFLFGFLIVALIRTEHPRKNFQKGPQCTETMCYFPKN